MRAATSERGRQAGEVYDACLDLLLGSSCTVCTTPGRLLCPRCEAALPRAAHVVWPTPCPSGLALPMAAGEYAGALKALINAHKERRAFALVRPLGQLLAQSTEAVMEQHDPAMPWILVPVPSRGPVVRSRGHDPLLRVTRRAAAVLRGRGRDVVVVRLLSSVSSSRDQTGLDAAERSANLAGSMRCRPRPAQRRPDGSSSEVRLLVTDDVLTTGATAREAQRALEERGTSVTGIVTIAATRKRLLSTS